MDQALAYGVKVLGNTAHFVDKDIDTGKIIAQSVLPIEDYREYEEVLALQIDIWQNIDTKVQWVPILKG